MERLFALGRSFGCTDVQLTCDPHNAPGMAFYGSLGMGVKTVQYQMKLSYQSCEPSKKPAARPGPLAPCLLKHSQGALSRPCNGVLPDAVQYAYAVVFTALSLTWRMASVILGLKQESKSLINAHVP